MRRTGGDLVVVAGALWLAAAVPPAGGEERPKTSTAVQAPAQGGEGTEPVLGAPPPIEPPMDRRLAPGAVGPAPGAARPGAAPKPVRALSIQAGEATLEVAGVREVVRPGSRLGGDTVRSVSPDRIVLEREAKAGEPGGSAIVILTFDGAGRGTTRVFWTADPFPPKAPEVSRP
jgi:hypothetical protein